jgi:hypothetical protein
LGGAVVPLDGPDGFAAAWNVRMQHRRQTRRLSRVT